MLQVKSIFHEPVKKQILYQLQLNQFFEFHVKFTWNENRKNASDVFIKLNINTSLRALQNKWIQLGRTAANVQIRQTMAICSFVKCNLEKKGNEYSFFESIKLTKLTLIYRKHWQCTKYSILYLQKLRVPTEKVDVKVV